MLLLLQFSVFPQRKNDTYEFLSGVAITPRTQFLSLHENADDLELFQTVIHYAHYAVRVYGWPIYVMTSKLGLCRICPDLSCCVCLTCRKISADVEVVDDNCCRCNYAVLQKLNDIGDIEIIYVTYHVDVGETPFFVALDYDRKKVVISIRGTLSMQVSQEKLFSQLFSLFWMLLFRTFQENVPECSMEFFRNFSKFLECFRNVSRFSLNSR